MPRRFVTLAALIALVVAGSPAQGQPVEARLQQDDVQIEPIAAARELELGEIFPGPGYDMIVSDFLSDPTPLVPGSNNVQVAVSVRNSSGVPVPLYLSGGRVQGLPEIVLRDANAVQYPVELLRPLDGVKPGTDILTLEPEMSARWSLGFTVPTSVAGDLTLVTLENGTAVAEWPLEFEEDQDPVSPGWRRPGLPVVEIDQAIEWQPDVTMVPRATGTLVCGDPQIEPVAHIFTVAFDVTNGTNDTVIWPGLEYQGPPIVAQWSDGSSSDLFLETFWGDDEFLPRVSGSAVQLPALTTATRALVFSAPRDGRFVDLNLLPDGLRLPTSDGDLWLDLSTVAPSVSVDAAMCDLGGLGAPIPWAVAPSPTFQFGAEDLALVKAAQDARAQGLLTEVGAAVTQYYDANGRTLLTMSETNLQPFVPNVTVDEFVAPQTVRGALGEVYFSTTGSDFLLLVTRSETGTWFCTGGNLFSVPISGRGGSLNEAGGICDPDSYSATT